jgi:hypothetical protein
MKSRRIGLALSFSCPAGNHLGPDPAERQHRGGGQGHVGRGDARSRWKRPAPPSGKVRSVVSDAQGQYKIVDLRPGNYVVTFSLTGFSTVKRDGIELTTESRRR